MSETKIFHGVHFVLLGFDPINKTKVLSKLVDGGGVDVGAYGPNCTHVIVDKLVYDDPICVAARSDGKILVTALWVAHSIDVGIPVDPFSIMYRPLKELEGIPGAKSLIVCLTGYQRHDRDDIMTMVGLMGANFSKPLIANKVTHLICYKFEGEKYELAMKMKKKLVNHRWLEDCLKAWEILPEADYEKSGYALEMMEAEAKDSEEAAEDVNTKQYEGKVASPHQHRISNQEVSRNSLVSSASKVLSNVGYTNDMVSVTGKETVSDQAPNLDEIHNKHPEVFSSCDLLRDVTYGEPSKSSDRTENPERIGNDLTSTSRSAKGSPHSDAAKLCALSYSRKKPRRTTPPMFSREKASNLRSTPLVNISKFSGSDSFDISSSTVEQAKDGIDFSCVKTPSKGTESLPEEAQSGLLPEKRKWNVSSCGSSKLQKTSHNPKARISEGLLMVNRTELFEPASTINTRVEINNHLSHMPLSNTITLEIRQEEAFQTSSMGLKKAEHAIGEAREPENEVQDIEISSHRTKTIEIEKSNSSAKLDLLEGGKADEHSKPLERKMFGKKFLRSKQGLGKGNTKNQKGSIHLNTTASQIDDVTCSIGGKETADHKFVNSENLQIAPPVVNVDTVMRMETNDVPQPGNEVESNSVFMDDETESPEEKAENECDATVGEQKYGGEVELDNIEHIVTEERSEDMQHTTITSDGSIVGMHDHMMPSDNNKDGIEQEVAVCDKKTELGESTHIKNVVKEKITKGKKRRSSKIKKKIVPSVTKITDSNETANEEAKSEKNNEKTEVKKEESIPHLAGKTKRTPVNNLENPVVLEKDYRPIGSEDRNVNHGKKQVGKVACNKSPRNIDPVWFILSGHELQRKEFQKVIRRLKGRVCRDSHHWSYEATHFIVPDPIRRTEKLCAAAASGSWILKTDYLTASNQAGRLLAEEPYEWHKNGLSEDGAISLEAPRKWRLLRERTGHGAFYGMHIIVYGDFITPPLDTLKRVVKAGYGTILATSPPYNRFLETGVDFAIVSPGMPRADIWVQEFLNYEIPCVVADYLVEYVCKPGYSLERHVQYSTHAWAEKSYQNLMNRIEEIVEER